MSVKVLAKDKIVQAYNLINHLEPLHVCSVFGVPKLKKKIEAEIKFLNKSLRSDDVKEEHVHCSNISQLASLVEVATSVPNVTAVLKSFDIGNGEKLIIDVVGENQCKWYKVILRNPKALHQLHIFGGRNGVRPLDAVARDILTAAQSNPVFFVPPKVCFYFVNGVSDRLAKSLQMLGVEVRGQVKSSQELGIPFADTGHSTGNSSADESDQEKSKSSPKVNQTKPKSQPGRRNGREAKTVDIYDKVNLDVTCLIAYVTSTSNGGCDYVFDDKFLNEQAQDEKKKPVKDVLNAYFKDKELLVCEEVAKHFRTLLETMGGEEEKRRAEELLKRCTVVPSQPIFNSVLKKGGRVKDLSRVVFATGHAYRAPTITANRGFVRAAQNQGLKLAVLYHEPRALTEKKEGLMAPKSLC